jgi:hypothetical protein
MEEEAIFSLLQMMTSKQSAFSRSSICSWVYLEMTMNGHLQHLLKCAPEFTELVFFGSRLTLMTGQRCFLWTTLKLMW